jgi:phytanoyl-CoA dioxygenase PhyH
MVNLFSGLVDVLKREAAESLWRLPRHAAGATSMNDARKRLLTDGYCVIPGFLDPHTVDTLAAKAEELYGNHPEYVALESNGTDKRIYGAERLAADFGLEDELRSVDTLGRAFYWTENIVWFQMLGKISYHENNLGSGSGWHRDSPFSHQFKAILYLTDVNDENGPFQYIRGSHAKRSLAEVSRRLGLPGSSYRFSSRQIEQLENTGTLPRRTSVTGAKGTLLLADSRGLHRGKPLLAGERLAVTRYYFPRRIPLDFASGYPLIERRRR